MKKNQKTKLTIVSKEMTKEENKETVWQEHDLKPLMEELIADENTVLIHRTLRSGQSLRYNGNVVVLGDINPGAEVVASGHVLIMGSLRGMVHAGATGNEKAIVTAFRLQPTQLRIANHITRAPDDDFSPNGQPEIARIRDGIIVIECYQPNGEKTFKIF